MHVALPFLPIKVTPLIGKISSFASFIAPNIISPFEFVSLPTYPATFALKSPSSMRLFAFLYPLLYAQEVLGRTCSLVSLPLLSTGAYSSTTARSPSLTHMILPLSFSSLVPWILLTHLSYLFLEI